MCGGAHWWTLAARANSLTSPSSKAVVINWWSAAPKLARLHEYLVNKVYLNEEMKYSKD